MKTSSSLKIDAEKIVVALGFFDGVHLGHQALFQEALKKAQELGGESWALTFETHPLTLLKPEAAPDLILPRPKQLKLLAEQGLDGCLNLPFTRELASLSPEAFISKLAEGIRGLKAVVVGTNWRFGKNAAGSVRDLETLAKKHGFQALIVPSVLYENAPISSTRIRQAIREGNVSQAARMMGRPYAVEGQVQKGRQVGRSLGFPTANIQPDETLIPHPGIYAAWGTTEGAKRPGAVYISSHQPRLVEIHLLDTRLDLYGKPMRIEFTEHIRGDLDITDQAGLKKQITRDIDACRAALTP